MAVKKSARTTSKGGAAEEKGGGRRSAREARDEGGGMSKADAFDNVKPQGHVEAGKYEAVIVELVLQKPDANGQSVRAKYMICTEGDYQGEQISQWYKLFEADETPGKGAAFLKKDLAVLGYEDVKFGELEDVFEEIVEKKLGVVITVKQNPPYTNVYLGGLCEDSTVIEAALEKFPL